MMAVLRVVLLLVIFHLGLIKNQKCDKNIDDDLSFDEYVTNYELEIPNDEIRQKFKKQFYKTKKEIETFNADPKNSYKQTINKFAHLSTEEIFTTSLGLSLLRLNYPSRPPLLAVSATKCPVAPIDWRKKGAVTPIKDQGTCGNCFIFSAVGAIESLVYLKTKQLYNFSEQYVMDCISKNWKIRNDACLGGQPDYAYDLVISKQGLPLSVSYPFMGIDLQACPSKMKLIKDAAIKSYITLNTINEDEIVCNLMNGPMSVAVSVNNSFLRYSSGIYNDVASCGPNMILNHAVLMGYDVDPVTKKEYYIIKNSWGTDYGEKGYIRMEKGINLCGITTLVQQPSFDSSIFPFG